MDFKEFYLLSEMHAHVLSQQPTNVIAYRDNVWAFDDNWLPRLAAIPKIIQAQHPQQLAPSDNIQSINQLLSWLKEVGDAIVARIYSGGTLKGKFEPTSPLLPKVINALAKKGIQVKPEFSTAPGQQQPGMDQTPKVGYHGTNSNNLGTILKNGLTPSGGTSSWTVRHEDKIFLATNFDTAKMHAINSVAKTGGGAYPVVIAFNIKDPARLGADYDVDKESTPTAQRPSQYEATRPDEKYSTSPMQASKHAGLFSFQGTLNPQSIRGVWVADQGVVSKFRQLRYEEIGNLKSGAMSKPPNYALNFPKKKQPAAAPHNPEDWSVDFGAGLVDDEPQYPQAIPVQQQPPTATPAQQPKKPWWKMW